MILEKSAGAVVFFGGGEGAAFLLIKAGYWEFPKGLVEAGEDERDAARREVREETGLEVELVEGFREAIGYFYRRKNGGGLVKKEVVYFLAEARAREQQLSWEHQEAQWVSYKEAMEMLKYENARAILEKANAAIAARGA